MNAEQLLDWMTHHYLPLELFREEDSIWVVSDAHSGTVIGYGETAENALREAAEIKTLANSNTKF